MDETTAPIPHSWREFIWLSLGLILASGGSYLAAWFKRKQPEAETEKTRAETRSIDLNTTMHAGDMLLKLMEQVAIATANVEQLQKEKEFQRTRAELLQRQLDEYIKIGKGD